MANTYFKFKQFTVNQANTAMKVGTDGVLLGAWTDVCDASRVLDIGTGTGLVSLMMAQRCEAQIMAIDIENMDDARENFELSLWKSRLELRQISLQELETESFDHIVSNPPYFNNSLHSPDKSRTSARHTASLSYKQLAVNCARLLAPNGRVSLILPAEAYQEICNLFDDLGFSPTRVCYVKPRENLAPKRVMLEFSKDKSEIKEEIFSLETDIRGCRTKEYQELTKEYYLDR